MTDTRPDAEMRTWRVHVPLGILFGVLWLLTALHLLVLLHEEVWQWDSLFILYCAAPPVMPVVFLATGHVVSAGLPLALLLIVGLPWWLAARQPEARWRLKVAVATVVGYWIFFDLGLATAA